MTAPSEDRNGNQSLRDEFYELIVNLPDLRAVTEDDGSSVPNEVEDAFETQLPAMLTRVLPTDTFSISGAVLSDAEGYLPVLGVYHTSATGDTARVFVAYLVDPVRETVTLALLDAPRISQLKTDTSTTNRDQTVASAVPIADSFARDTPPLDALPAGSDRLLDGVLRYKQYTLDAFPSEDEFISDLLHFTAAYRHHIDTDRGAARRQRVWSLRPSGAPTTWFDADPYIALTQTLSESDRPRLSDQDVAADLAASDTAVAQATAFHTQLRPGDIVVVCDGTTDGKLYGIGEIQTPAYYRDSKPDSTRRSFHAGVEWAAPMWPTGLEFDIPYADTSQFSPLPVPDYLAVLRVLARHSDPTVSSLAPYLSLLSEAHFATSPDPENIATSVTNAAPYYWFTKGEKATFEDDPTRFVTPCSRDLAHDVATLDRGDHVFVCLNGELPYYVEITSTAYPVLNDDTAHDDPVLRAAVDCAPASVATDLTFSEVFADLLELDRGTTGYPVSEQGLNGVGVRRLTNDAGTYLHRRFNGATPQPRSRTRLEKLLQHEPVTLAETPGGLYFEPDTETRLLHEINTALSSGKHIIFSGPPGTGKTKLARHLCKRALAQRDTIDDYRFTTSTAEWTTFDTIGGYMPDTESTGESLEFRPRLFLNCLRDDDGIRNDWLVVDELNRADIDRALGPLFSVLSQDSVSLPYERTSTVSIDWVDGDRPPSERDTIADDPDRFPMTPAWELIGTMNTVDKTSLYDLSFAFMRRFNFIHVGVPELSRSEDGDIVVTGHQYLQPPAEDRLQGESLPAENYAWVWVADEEAGAPQNALRETLDHWAPYLGTLWMLLNQDRTIGPAIIRDMIAQLRDAEVEDKIAFTSAMTTLVFPQLEGLRERHQRDLIDSLSDTYRLSGDNSHNSVRPADRLNMAVLRRDAREAFNWEHTYGED